MTREEATARSAELNLGRRPGDPRWTAQEVRGQWRPVLVRVPGLVVQEPGAAHVESRPRPEAPDDPRQGPLRQAPPLGGI